MAAAEPGTPASLDVDELLRSNVRMLMRVQRRHQKELAQAIGVGDGGTFSKILRGEQNRRFQVKQLPDLARALDVPVDALFARDTDELASYLNLTIAELLERAKTPCFNQTQLWPVAVKDAS